MSSSVVENTSLWKNTLAERDSDDHRDERSRLRSAFWAMRENVIPFVQAIHRDVLGLTVHDETHLDALWQTADQICGQQFEVNALEGFVFGAAVLLHDTAMALAAYPGGIQELRQLQLWKDVAAQYDEESTERIQFTVLRELHAEQAEELANISFRREGHSENLFLLDDTKLRDALASQIGRIAHSHHWDQKDLVEQLNRSSGGVPGFPSIWTVDEVKVACMLRCADAAHIDSRRAPTYLYAISNVSGESNDHWSFQNKLNQLSVESDKAIFTSGSDFELQDSAAWWVCHDTLRMIDRELKGCNAILSDMADTSFAVNGIKGIETPILLSRHIRTKGWLPIDAEVRVSNPVHLARTLGGENLYGTSTMPPIREVLQNAVDAIRARRSIEERDDHWGLIRITVESDGVDGAVLHIDDQGVGMSERVLTGPLIDFGSSFWGSDLARNEFPGLISRKPSTIGKFGIGFFAVFLLGNNVSVASRRYDAGRESEKVLAFEELSRRPLIRPAVTGEIPRDFCTRVSVKLNDNHLGAFVPGASERNENTLSSEIRKMVCALNVDVAFRNKLTDEDWNHSASWAETDPSVFLEEVGFRPDFADHSSMIERTRVLRNEDGAVVGRAAFIFQNIKYNGHKPLISVGGFTSYRERNTRANWSNSKLSDEKSEQVYFPNMAGVVVGETGDAIRSYATPSVDVASVSAWATEQANLIDPDCYLDDELVNACIDLMRAGGDTGSLPFAIAGGRFISWASLKSLIESEDELFIGIKYRDYSDKFEFRSFASVGSVALSGKVRSNFVILRGGGDLEWLSKDEAREIFSAAGGSALLEYQVAELQKIFEVKMIIEQCKAAWGHVSLSISKADVTSESVTSQALLNWTIRLSKAKETAED